MRFGKSESTMRKLKIRAPQKSLLTLLEATNGRIGWLISWRQKNISHTKTGGQESFA
jgi:hypothetical protein